MTSRKIEPHNRAGRLFRDIRANTVIYLMVLPGLAFLAITKFIPYYGLQVAFKDFDPFLGVWDSSWVGLKYFVQAFRSTVFWRTFGNTVIISFYKLLVGLPAPVILAIMLNELKLLRFKKIVQTISYFPYFISWVVMGGLAVTLFGTEYGFINRVLSLMGVQPVLFYQNADVWRPILVGTEVWKNVGWGSILYLAALSSVNTDLYEAISIDGGGRRHRIWHVDIPTLTPVFVIMIILRSADLFSGNFDQVYALIGDSIIAPNSLLARKVETLEIFTYRVGLIEGSFGFASAVGFLQNLLSAIVIFVTNHFAGRISEDKRFTLF